MTKLLEVLDKLYSNPGNYEIDEWDKKKYFVDNELSKQAIFLCEELLITGNGGCNWDNIHELRNSGYRVYPGERDSFGWLTGCVQKHGDERILVYG